MTPQQAQPAEATAYLQVQLKRRSAYSASDARVVAVTQKKPDRPQRGCIVVKVKLRIPVEGWDPFEPSVIVDVPTDLIDVGEIFADVEDATT